MRLRGLHEEREYKYVEDCINNVWLCITIISLVELTGNSNEHI